MPKLRSGFACELNPKKPQDCNELQDNGELPNGRVFAVRRQPLKFTKIVPKLLKKDIDYFLKDGEQAQLYHWQPWHQNNRIIAQQSIFLFGRYEFESDDQCIIAGSSRKIIMNTLHQVSGITEDSLFPDFERFARLRSAEVPYTELTASDYRRRGDEAAHHRGEYEEAIGNYDMAINLAPDDAILYYLRGLAKHKLQRYEGALIDYTKAIEQTPDYADVYSDRGQLNYELERYSNALDDYDIAIDLASYDDEAYIGRGLVNYKLEEYENALADFDMALNMGNNGGRSLQLPRKCKSTTEGELRKRVWILIWLFTLTLTIQMLTTIEDLSSNPNLPFPILIRLSA